jgi:hypothetical protein
MKLTATSVAWIFAAAFYAAGAIGFIPNSLLGAHGLFMTNPAHNIFHLLTGVGFTAVALTGSRASIVFMQTFGALYLFIGVIGFSATEPGGHGTCSASSISTPLTTSST